MIPEDDIVAEVRAVREAYFAQFNYDLAAFVRHLQERQKSSGLEFVPAPPKPVDPYSPHPSLDRDAA